MASVNALAYLGITGPDLDAWKTYANNVLGLQLSPSSTDDKLVLRMDERVYRFFVEQGDPGFSAIGFEVKSRGELEELGAQVEAAGFAVKEDPSLAKERQVVALLQTSDPAGNAIELSYGQRTDHDAFASPKGHHFVTGDMGLGHVFMMVPDQKEAFDYYVGVLGFRESDTIELMPGLNGQFLHCNPRHHTLAFAAVPGMNISGVQHMMVEVESLDHVGRAFDIVDAGAATVSTTIGMHTNDEMISFYMQTPSGFDCEFGTAGRKIDDSVWSVGHYEAASYWGHKRMRDMPVG
jgi:3,4-dihydroxy-9,10-secoandrosta-1,3,5(10)-triene-9,17-dione 4,5-dioxygenase